MPGVCRLFDKDTGHGCFPPRPNTKGSPDCFVDKRPVHRKTDTWMPHCCPGHGCHPGTTSSGSTTVFVNKLNVARIGDSISCGGTIAQGSTTVIIG